MLLLFAGSSSVAANADRPSAANAAVKIDNFFFGPRTITVPVGKFTKAGTYSYYCSVHPKMTGQAVVK
jgi:plastocyanin